jgi:hypothetical protein
MKRRVAVKMPKSILLFLFLPILSLHAEIPESVRNRSDVKDLFSKTCLHLSSDGTVDADFSALLKINARNGLLDAVQREYAAMLPEGEEPEFKVKEVAAGEYVYTNRKQQTSHLNEILRNLQPDGMLHAVFIVRGERFFGRFKALVHVEIENAGSQQVHYSVDVFAWPENVFTRLVARGMHFAVESFFRRKTRYMTTLVVDICARLVEDHSDVLSSKVASQGFSLQVR